MLHVSKDTNNDHDTNQRNLGQLFPQKNHQNEQNYRENQRNDIEIFKQQVHNVER